MLTARVRRVLTVAALVVVAGAVAASARGAAPSDAERVDRIVAELRCPVCQGLSVGDSPSETARQMRDLVAQRVAEGRSDAEIREEFRNAYGDWVFLAPPVLGWTGAVWLLPLAAIAIGGVIAWRRLRRAPPEPETDPSPADIALLHRRAREEALEG